MDQKPLFLSLKPMLHIIEDDTTAAEIAQMLLNDPQLINKFVNAYIYLTIKMHTKPKKILSTPGYSFLMIALQKVNERTYNASFTATGEQEELYDAFRIIVSSGHPLGTIIHKVISDIEDNYMDNINDIINN